MKPAFCANCISERDDLAQRTTDKGITVWICPDCDDPVLAMRIHEPLDRESGLSSTGFRNSRRLGDGADNR